MGVSVEINESVQEATLVVQGDFKFDQQQSFVNAFRELDPNLRRCWVDLRHANHVESTALWALLELRTYFGHDPIDRVSIIYSTDGLVAKTLDVVKLGQLFGLRPVEPAKK